MAETQEVRNLYRRHYASYVRGRRINLLSLEAEAWFWRIHDTSDDYGNNEGDALLCYARTVGARRGTVTPVQVDGWIEDMIVAELVVRYVADDGIFLHFLGFTKLQPAGKNGRRVRQFPQPPFSEEEIDASALPTTNTKSGGIRGNPRNYNPQPCPMSHVPRTITHEPLPIIQADPDDDSFASFFREHPGLIWSPVAEARMRKLVDSAGWPQAKLCIDTAIARGAGEPTSYALTVWSGEQARERLGNGRMTKQQQRDAEIEQVLAEIPDETA